MGDFERALQQAILPGAQIGADLLRQQMQIDQRNSEIKRTEELKRAEMQLNLAKPLLTGGDEGQRSEGMKLLEAATTAFGIGDGIDLNKVADNFGKFQSDIKKALQKPTEENEVIVAWRWGNQQVSDAAAKEYGLPSQFKQENIFGLKGPSEEELAFEKEMETPLAVKGKVATEVPHTKESLVKQLEALSSITGRNAQEQATLKNLIDSTNTQLEALPTNYLQTAKDELIRLQATRDAYRDAGLSEDHERVKEVNARIAKITAPEEGFKAGELPERVSRAMFGVPFENATQKQQQQINNKVEEIKNRRAALQGGISDKAQQQGQEALKETELEMPDVSRAVSQALKGTGPLAQAQAFIDSAFGFMSDDVIFKDTVKARQSLRLLRQLGKRAFLNSSRGPVFELQIIDKLYPDPDKTITNPSTEAQKIPLMAQELVLEKRLNNERLAKGGLTNTEVRNIRDNIAAIDQILRMVAAPTITDGDSGGGTTSSGSGGTTSSGNRWTIEEVK